MSDKATWYVQNEYNMNRKYGTKYKYKNKI